MTTEVFNDIATEADYREAVIRTVKTGEEPAELVNLCISVGKSVPGFRADVARARHRFELWKEAQPVEELLAQRTAKARERAAIEREAGEKIQRLNEQIKLARQPLEDFDARGELEDLKAKLMAARSSRQELARHVDPTTKRRIDELGKEIAASFDRRAKLRAIVCGRNPNRRDPETLGIDHWREAAEAARYEADNCDDQRNKPDLDRKADRAAAMLAKLEQMESALEQSQDRERELRTQHAELQRQSKDWQNFPIDF